MLFNGLACVFMFEYSLTGSAVGHRFLARGLIPWSEIATFHISFVEGGVCTCHHLQLLVCVSLSLCVCVCAVFLVGLYGKKCINGHLLSHLKLHSISLTGPSG